jgi:hypothetical protein
MHIKKTLEGPEGTFEFEGELSPGEVTVVIEAGLNTLFQAGALPFTHRSELHRVSPGNGGAQ